MIISVDWIKDFVEIRESLQDLADLLTNIGFEAEITGTPESLDNVVIGKVESVNNHPNADRLKVCSVNDGTDIHQVICGAPNVDNGQSVAFAKIGAILPGNIKIKKAKIRGIESFGMICSERELLISDEHDGILILPDELIAKEPPKRREQARLLVLNRAEQSIGHRSFSDLPDLLSPGDCLVLNDTKVVPARIVGERSATGGRWEGLYLSSSEEHVWQLIGQTDRMPLPQ